MADTKICGIRTTDALAHAHKHRAKWVGMVFYPPSPRHLSLDEARILSDFARTHTPDMERVALVVDADDDALDGIIEASTPKMLQCHGDESPQRIRAIRQKFNIPVMKAIKVHSAQTLTDARAFEGAADMLLFDAYAQTAPLPGGTGVNFDWSIMQGWEGTTPWMLAGGLTPHNVAHAVAVSGAKAVDVSSGVESALGVKDLDLIEGFLNAAQSARVSL